MRYLLALLLLPSVLFGAVAANTQLLIKCDNTIADTSGNGYTLAPIGTAVPFASSPTPPRGTKSAGLFASGIRYDLSAGFTTWMKNATQFTAEAMVYYPTSSTINIDILFSAEGANFILALNSNGVLRWYSSAAEILSNSTLPRDQWVSIASVWPGGNSRKMYINNSLDKSSSTSGSVAGVAGPFSFGNWQTVASYPWQGYAQYFRVSSVERTSFPTTDPSDVSGVALVSPLSPSATARIKPYKPHR